MRSAGAGSFVSMTVGIAVATTLLVAGILAGPAILDCSGSESGIGACLRAKATAAGWLPAARARPGRVDADAEATSPADTTTATLSAGPDMIGASAASSAFEAADVAMSRGQGTIAPASEPQASIADKIVALAGSDGQLLTEAAAPHAPTASGISISAPAGRLDAAADQAQMAVAAPASLAPLDHGLEVVSAGKPPSPAAADAVLSASVGVLSGDAGVVPLAPIVATIDASAAPGAASIDGIVGPEAQIASIATLSPSGGSVGVVASPSTALPQSAVALAAPAGLSVEPAASSSPPDTIVATVSPVAQVEAIARGAVGGNLAASASAILVAPSAPEPPKAAAVDPPPARSTATDRVDPPAADPPAVRPSQSRPRPKATHVPTLKADRRYPNFVVLSMPRGRSSSVVTLQVK